MKIIKSLLYILSIALFFSCKKQDNKIEFTFLQINDVYEIGPIQGGEFGGLARVETVHQELLKENKNTMLFMAGDFLNPSLLGTIKVDGERVRGKQMVEVMNAMNVDLVAFGNHEFDVSQQDLQKRLNESNFPWISANVKLKTKEKSIPFYKEVEGKQISLGETFIKEFTDEDGTKIKVGFISVCIPSNPVEYVEYGNMFVKARASYAAIKDSVDVVFGLTHVKLTNDKRIAKLLPNLPLIMGGHEHTNSYDKIGNVIISKADANAKTAYIHRIFYDKKTKKTIVKSELKEINASIKSDKKVGLVVTKWQNILKTQIKDIIENPDEIIYKTKIPLDGRDTQIRSEKTNLGTIITKSMSFAFEDKVDCAIVNGGSIRIDDELVGDINAVDIFRVLPYGGAIFKVEITGRLLKRVLDYGLLAAGTGAYLQRFNAEKVDEKWFIKNQELDIKKTYTVAFSDYLLQGFDIPFLSSENKEVLSVYNPKKNELAFDIRKAVIAYLKTQK
ncbi:bifunctional metallophosphatase/5'-nucleotidase [Polaribacter glomeratus]|uniref:Bifunctional metallophosphatase/5'-nucleotidase n=1 Tax=Polaribacter glomeratus TaxID=102 RepID=A0A2S7WVG2_9FLAO|nr:bifunctional metallophosphatase/5'-nucleotidase [Polaribacter glomeratus]PQJ81589.1 bifunctional metallophosphatase/5'-nucleotidase [Polaribacter glomeratus]TXD66486.1 bifunctional metallophosphatase/5'-nucleotidase [Polaribacter glomeratus]